MSAEKIDITKVGDIIQDFSNKKIEILSTEGYSLWENSYKSEQTFNRVFSSISKSFSQELARRENQQAG